MDIAKKFEAARQAHENAQPKLALRHCQQILEQDPKQAAAHHLMGLIFLSTGDMGKALSSMRLACERPGVPVGFLSNYAEVCRRVGYLAEAEQAARKAIALNPRFMNAWNNLGIILQEAGKLQESLHCLEQVLKAEPSNARAHNNVANTAKRLGLIKKARAHWEAALRLDPNYAEGFSNFSILLNEEGDYAKAARFAEHAIKLNGRLADAYVNLAAVYTAKGDHLGALNVLEQVDAQGIVYIPCLTAKAAALLKLDRLEEAEMIAQKAVDLASQRADVHQSLAQVFQEQGKFDEAQASFERAIAVPGNSAERALTSLAVLHMQRGHKEEAEAAFARILEHFPNSIGALFNRSDLRRYQAGDPDVGKMERLLSSPQHQSRSDQTSLHFALGKAYLDIGDSRTAFHHLEIGNRLKRETISYDPDATHRWMQSIPRVMTPQVISEHAGEGARSKKPFFIVGMPRSGTTLLEQILGAHSAITPVGELKHLQRACDLVGNFPPEPDALSAEKLEEAGRHYLGQTAGLLEGRQHTLDKMPANFLRAGLLHLILPDAKIIHSRRNPVDTCLSCYSKLFAGEQAFTYNLTELGRFYRDYEELMAYWKSVIPAANFTEIAYEDLVADQLGETRRLLEFLELPWDDACVQFYKNEGVVKTASVNQVRQPIYTTSQGRWKKHRAELAPLLQALGLAGEDAAMADAAK